MNTEPFGKRLEFVVTTGVADFCEEIELSGYVMALLEIWDKTPIIGMHIFENVTEGDQLRLKITVEGTDTKRNELVGPREVYRVDSLKIPVFWAITEDHGEFVLVTFLLPSEY